MKIKLTLSLLTLATALSGAAPHWPQFRGPGGNASATAQAIPLAFGPAKNVRWKLALPPGHFSPCIWGDRIFLTGHVGPALKMICVRGSDGKVLWERERTIPKLPTYEHVTGNPANSTPTTDGERVVFQFDDYGVVVTVPAVLTTLVHGRWLKGIDGFDSLSKIECPTLLLGADPACGGMLDESEAAQIMSPIPQCAGVESPGVSHSIHSTRPDKMLAPSTKFLEINNLLATGTQP